MDVRIRPVEPHEGERLREIAIAAKGYWGYDRDRTREWAAIGDLSPAGLQQKDFYIAEVEGRVVGWAAAIGKGDVWWLDDLWIDPDWMGKSIGSRLFRDAAERAASGHCSNGVGGGAERPRLLRQDGRPLPARQRARCLGSR